jgi:hypothetical protein
VKAEVIFVGLLLMAAAPAQQNDAPQPKGVIYGVAIDQAGRPAKRMGLTAEPLGVPLAAILPHTKTNDAGEYRFENLPWWGRYTVYADDEDAGYSSYSTGPDGETNLPEAEIAPERPEAQLTVVIPPKAGFVHVNLQNQRTGAGIPGMRVAVMPEEEPTSPIFSISCYSNRALLVPPDKSLLLHITSDGFREWNESIGKGKLIHLASGTHLRIDVQLEPAE